jgi:hypothetical protein
MKKFISILQKSFFLILILSFTTLKLYSQSERCAGKTKAGDRCMKLTKNSSGFCSYHSGHDNHYTKSTNYNQTKKTSYTKSDNESSQCFGYSKSGYRCSRMTKSSNGYCYQHGGY